MSVIVSKIQEEIKTKQHYNEGSNLTPLGTGGLVDPTASTTPDNTSRETEGGDDETSERHNLNDESQQQQENDNTSPFSIIICPARYPIYVINAAQRQAIIDRLKELALMNKDTLCHTFPLILFPLNYKKK